MKFYDWITETHLDTKGAAGDLARDMEADFYTGENTKEAILAHLNSCGAIPECVAVFEKCWGEYEADPRRHEPSKQEPLPAPRPLIGAWEDSQHGSFLDLEKPNQKRLLAWIRACLQRGRTWHLARSSYALKHLFERDCEVYVTNAQFKDAMILAGYKPQKLDELNHFYRLHQKSPAFAPEGEHIQATSVRVQETGFDQGF